TMAQSPITIVLMMVARTTSPKTITPATMNTMPSKIRTQSGSPAGLLIADAESVAIIPSSLRQRSARLTRLNPLLTFLLRYPDPCGTRIRDRDDEKCDGVEPCPGSRGLRVARRRRAWRFHLGRAGPPARGAVAAYRRHLGHVGRSDEC